jgi:hypothetical protein
MDYTAHRFQGQAKSTLWVGKAPRYMAMTVIVFWRGRRDECLHVRHASESAERLFQIRVRSHRSCDRLQLERSPSVVVKKSILNLLKFFKKKFDPFQTLIPLCLVKEPDRIRKILDLKEFKNSDRRQQ